MSHSSKAALALASSFSTDIIAVGFSPILLEAIARGASDVFSVPLCDDPLVQLSFFPKEERFSNMIIGESPDWIFSGASMCGLISAKLGMNLRVYPGSGAVDSNYVTLVLDSGEEVSPIDIRRITSSLEVPVNPEGVLGNSGLKKLEERESEFLKGSSEEIAATISRRLRRITKSWNAGQ